MNYRHIYHAGFFADVVKHVVLVSLIQCLLRKDKPFCYVDTHAGIGSYQLHAPAAQQTQEYQQGIIKVLQAPPPYPQLVGDYLRLIAHYNSGSLDPLSVYPGSPALVHGLLRDADRMILTELHPDDYVQLKRLFHHDKRVAVHHRDGYQALTALLPPKPARGLVLIDPPFEKRDEFTTLATHLELAIQRWHTASFAVWFPIKNRVLVQDFYARLRVANLPETLVCELTVPKLTENGLHSCGMLIVRPPWQWQATITPTLEWLTQALAAPGRGELLFKSL